MQQETSFSEAINKRYPEEVVIVIVKSKNGTYNPITVGWTMLASKNPPIIAVASTEKRYSFDLISTFKEFVIAYPSDTMENETFFFGTKSGREVNKLCDSKIKYSKAKYIDSVILDEAVANFECVLEDTIKTGDHYIFLGKVVGSHISTKDLNRLYNIGPKYKLGKINF